MLCSGTFTNRLWPWDPVAQCTATAFRVLWRVTKVYWFIAWWLHFIKIDLTTLQNEFTADSRGMSFWSLLNNRVVMSTRFVWWTSPFVNSNMINFNNMFFALYTKVNLIRCNIVRTALTGRYLCKSAIMIIEQPCELVVGHDEYRKANT